MSLNDFDRQVVNESFYVIVVHDGKSPAKLNMELLSLLQQQETTVFTPKAVYDGQKILFSTREFLDQNASQKVIFFMQIPVNCADSVVQFFVSRPRSEGPPKVYEIIVTKTATINSEYVSRSVFPNFIPSYVVYRILQRFTAKNLSHDENVSTVVAVGHLFVLLF